MEIVIKIPKEIYTGEQTAGMLPILVDAIGKGIPLPEHHGRLIDADMLKQSFKNHHDFFLNAYDGDFLRTTSKERARLDEITISIAEVVNAPTIIEGSESEC